MSCNLTKPYKTQGKRLWAFFDKSRYLLLVPWQLETNSTGSRWHGDGSGKEQGRAGHQVIGIWRFLIIFAQQLKQFCCVLLHFCCAGHEGSRILRSRLLWQVAGHDQPGPPFVRVTFIHIHPHSRYCNLESCNLYTVASDCTNTSSKIGKAMAVHVQYAWKSYDTFRFTPSSSWRVKLWRRRKARRLRHGAHTVDVCGIGAKRLQPIWCFEALLEWFKMI